MRLTAIFLAALFCSILSFSQQNTMDNNVLNRMENDSTAVGFVVEKVPIYPGCNQKMKNDDLRQCMSDKITEFISNNFDKEIGHKNNIPSGMVRIHVVYNINEDGDIQDIMAKSAYPELEAEAIRVVKLIPRLKPGYQDGKPVSVPYSLPIMLKVEGRQESNKTNPIYSGCNEDLGYELLKKCTTERIMDFLKVSIDMEAVDKMFPMEKSTQFQANFVIDKKGAIKDIKVKAHKREMAVLAIMTLKRLPKLKLPKSGKEKVSDTSFEFLMTLYLD